VSERGQREGRGGIRDPEDHERLAVVRDEPVPAGDTEGPGAVDGRVDDGRQDEGDAVRDLRADTAPHQGGKEAEVQGGGQQAHTREAKQLSGEADSRG